MRILKIIVRRVRLPLRSEFRHAGAARKATENVVVEAVTDGGLAGFGEGVPRPYVTGETAESAAAALERMDYSFLSGGWGTAAEGVRALDEWEGGATREGTVFPGAARCALGLALLDAVGRTAGEGVTALARPFRRGAVRTGRVRYSAVCSASSMPAAAARLAAFRLYGFGAVKLKVGGGRDEALVRMARLLLGPRVDIRVDANGAWDTAAAMRLIPALERYGISSVEEPLSPGCRGDLPRLAAGVRVPIMLDESVCDAADAARALDSGACRLVNIRLSKCGGLLASLRLARLLEERGAGYQLGCQVGESGILSAAGRHFASLAPGLLHAEGSYDRHILARNPVREKLTFGYGGWAPPLGGPGLGVTVDRGALDALTARRIEIDL
ncbi:MAG: enolase C-terminal domain-like protein [bacterium]|nr:enolase C-terminal domain-like protein [bacterium]